MSKRLLIVLGYTLTSHGSIQPILKSRLDKALSICQPTDTILVCGKHAPKVFIPERCEHTTEAQAMKQYLIEHGISPENILKEERSATTFGNALYTYTDILKGTSEHYQSIIVISNEFHELLVRYCFDKVFGDHYIYRFFAVPDETLNVSLDEIQSWKSLIKRLVEECYPLLFSKTENGDIEAILSMIESPRREMFESKLRSLFHLNQSIEIAIASEEEFMSSKNGFSKVN